MKESEYNRLKKQAEKEYREKIAALDLVYSMAGGTGRKSKVSRSQGQSALAEAIRHFVSHSTGPFGALDVEKYLAASNVQFHQGSVRNILRRMEQSGLLTLVTKAAGRSPASYSKI